MRLLVWVWIWVCQTVFGRIPKRDFCDGQASLGSDVTSHKSSGQLLSLREHRYEKARAAYFRRPYRVRGRR